MQKWGIRNGTQRWRCGVHNNERMRVRYEALSGIEYNRLLLQRRRTKALARIRAREVES